jgi:hypothetical protein
MKSPFDRENLKLYLSVQALSKPFGSRIHPWRCLWRGSGQMTRTTPLRRMILHLRHIFFTEAITFIVAPSATRAPPFYFTISMTSCFAVRFNAPATRL